MSVSCALRRLLRIRELEEEQSRNALDSAQGELVQLEAALNAARAREQFGRRLVSDSAWSGEPEDWFAGLAESRFAAHHAVALSDRIESVEPEIEELRQTFLSRRVERLQSETLIKEAEELVHFEADRRSQRALDDGHGSRIFRGNKKAMRRSPHTGPASGQRSDTHSGQSDFGET